MTPLIANRYCSGDVCRASGRFRFDGYLDGSLDPAPADHEAFVTLDAGEVFPRVESLGLRCWWVPADGDVTPRDEGDGASVA